jgi:hypothetical protein
MIVHFPIVNHGYCPMVPPPVNAGAVHVILHEDDMDRWPDSPLGELVASSTLSEMVDEELESCTGDFGIDAEALPGLTALRDALAAEVAKLNAALLTVE